MAKFEKACELLLKKEGGYNNKKEDKGGATNFGISLKFLKTIDKTANEDTIKNLTQDEAESIYLNYFWLANHYDKINSQEIANKLFSTCVNSNPKVANKFLQQALNIVIFNGEPLQEDGILGTNTIKTVNLLSEEDVDTSILKVYSLLQKQYYANLVIQDNSQIIFLKGWFNRADELI